MATKDDPAVQALIAKVEAKAAKAQTKALKEAQAAYVKGVKELFRNAAAGGMHGPKELKLLKKEVLAALAALA